MCETGFEAGSVDDTALNLAITDAWRDEARAAGRRLAAIAELATRRLGSDLAAGRDHWGCDPVDSCAAEIACALRVSHRGAVAMMHRALDLRDRIPLVGELLRDGRITLHVAATASWRTRNVTDPQVLARVDADIAAAATRWGRYSDKKLIGAIDAIVARHDPDAVLAFRAAQRGMNVQFGKHDDDTGTRTVYGRMSAVDAEITERRMQTMVDRLCPNDPRTAGQRRSEAFGVIAAGGDHLPCLCGRADCPAPTGPDARGRLFEILVLTDDPDPGTDPTPDQNPDDGGPDDDGGPHRDPDYDWEPHWTNDPAEPEAEPTAEPEAEAEPEPEPEAEGEPESDSPTTGPDPKPTPCPYTAIIAGGAVLPGPLLADLVRMGAAVRTVTNPAALAATASYRPTTTQQRFIRARDITCRFPGCDRPAHHCDLDHTIAYPYGPTHPANTKALCRKHHLLKTFWVGRGGWSDRQLPDGTVSWTSPSGLTYHDPPGSRIYFPNWDPTTPPPPRAAAAIPEPAPGRELRIPMRARTRAQQRAATITAQRQRNHDLRERNPAPF